MARACMCVRVRACECMCLRVRVRVRVRIFSFVLLCARGSYCVWYLLWQLRARVCGASACCRNVLALRTSRYSRFVRLSMYIPDARIPVNSRLRPPARHTSIHNRPSHIFASPLHTKPCARAHAHAHSRSLYGKGIYFAVEAEYSARASILDLSADSALVVLSAYRRVCERITSTI